MHLNAWTLLLQAINFLLLVWLLRRFLYRPIVDAIGDRQAASNKLLDDAAAALQRAREQERMLADQKKALTEDVERVRADSKKEAGEARKALIAAADAEAEKIKGEARIAGVADLDQRRRELEADAARLATDIAARLLRRLPGTQIENAMFDALIDRMRALSPKDLTALDQIGVCTLVTQAPIDGDQRDRWATSLKTMVPHCRIEFAEDESLLAGCELRSPHMTIANSWRTDLETMRRHIESEADGHTAV